MRKRRLTACVVVPLAVGLLASGCVGGGNAAEAGFISVNSTEPENPLVPANTNETGGANVIDALFTGLVAYDPETNETQNEVAESINTPDNQNFTIKLKPGWTFHDGTPVTANSFVRAWNYAAYAPNGQSTASFFENIEGYDDLSPSDPDGDTGPQDPPPPTAQEMSGLRAVDDTTISVKLKSSFATWPTMLGYGAFSPMPDSFFADPEGFESHPVGNGPFKFASRQPNAFIKLVRNDQYQGRNKPQITGVEFRVYNELETAYQDLVSGDLDFLDQMPPSALVGDKWKVELRDRVVDKQVLSTNAFQLPMYEPKLQDPRVRHALSMAIDRKKIVEKVFENAYEPATGWVPNGPIKDYQPGGCGQYCEFNPKEAKKLLDEAGGFKGALTIDSNADGGHKEWIEAVCNQLNTNLGVQCVFNPMPTFAEFQKTHDENSHQGPFRFGWVADYPAAETFLGKVYRTGSSSNYMRYNSPEFDAAMDRADQAPTEVESKRLYREAENVLAKDMPSIPLWNQKAESGYSDRIDDVHVTFDRRIDLELVKPAS